MKKPLIIKLKRVGPYKEPHFRIVLTYVKSHGKIIEVLGNFTRNKSVNFLNINYKRLGYWLNKGIFLSVNLKILIAKYGNL